MKKIAYFLLTVLLALGGWATICALFAYFIFPDFVKIYQKSGSFGVTIAFIWYGIMLFIANIIYSIGKQLILGKKEEA